LARLPLKYFSPGEKLSREEFRDGRPTGRLPDGENYGVAWYKELPAGKEDIPLIIPELRQSDGLYVFGARTEGEPAALPTRPKDPFAAFGAIPGEPEILAKLYTRMAYLLEITGGLLLLIGMALNILFITMIMYLLL
jgi:hypothetical protein